MAVIIMNRLFMSIDGVKIMPDSNVPDGPNRFWTVIDDSKG